MNLKKILAGVAAGAMVFSSLAMPTFADDDIAVQAVLGFSDSGWAAQDWASSVTVTGDGTYTLTSTTVAGATDLFVFVVDFTDMFYDYPDATATLDSVAIDGVEVEFDASKILYGNIEDDKGNYRIEIYNEYGDTKSNPGIDNTLSISESLAVTFTVSGLSAADEAKTETETYQIVSDVNADPDSVIKLSVDELNEKGIESVTVDFDFSNGSWGGGCVGYNAADENGNAVWTSLEWSNGNVESITVNVADCWVNESDATDLQYIQIQPWWSAGVDLPVTCTVTYTYASTTDTNTATSTDTNTTTSTDDNTVSGNEADGDGDATPIAYLAVVVALAGVALVGSKKARA